MPRVWLEYAEFMMTQKKITRIRHIFDRALRSIAFTQHDRIWKLYIEFVTSGDVPVQTGIRVWKRYLKVCSPRLKSDHQYEPTQMEEFVDYLVQFEEWNEAAHQLVNIVNSEVFAPKHVNSFSFFGSLVSRPDMNCGSSCVTSSQSIPMPSKA